MYRRATTGWQRSPLPIQITLRRRHRVAHGGVVAHAKIRPESTSLYANTGCLLLSRSLSGDAQTDGHRGQCTRSDWLFNPFAHGRLDWKGRSTDLRRFETLLDRLNSIIWLSPARVSTTKSITRCVPFAADPRTVRFHTSHRFRVKQSRTPTPTSVCDNFRPSGASPR